MDANWFRERIGKKGEITEGAKAKMVGKRPSGGSDEGTREKRKRNG